MNSIPGRWWLTAVVVIVTAILLSPFYWVLVGSFMTPAELFGVNQTFWPRHFVVENWSKALERLWPHVQNSLMVSTATSIGTLLITAPAAYGLVWKKPIGRNALSSFMLVTQMLPGIVFVIPLFIVFSKINLVNTLFGLILADMTFTVPVRADHALGLHEGTALRAGRGGLVDGAGPFRAFLSVVLPITLPGLVTVGIFSFLMPWGDLLFALSLITESSLQPLTLELYKAFGQYGIDWGFLLARKRSHRDSGSHLRNSWPAVSSWQASPAARSSDDVSRNEDHPKEAGSRSLTLLVHSPFVIFCLVLLLYPVVYSLALSFREATVETFVSGEMPFNGLTQYQAALADPIFWRALINTLLFAFFSILFQFTIGFLLALLFQANFPLKNFCLAALLIPWVSPVLTAANIFKGLFNEVGPINRLFQLIGLGPFPWLSDPDYALPATIVANIWIGFPFNFILLYAGMRSIPEDVYEAAKIDGASFLEARRLHHLAAAKTRLGGRAHAGHHLYGQGF